MKGKPGSGEASVGGGGAKGSREQSWAEVAQGRPPPARWSMEKASPEAIRELQRYFAVVDLPDEVVDASRRDWEGLAVIARSLGRRVPVEWVSSEVQQRLKLPYTPEGLSLAEDHLVLRFRSPEDCCAVLDGGPWMVAGQLLAMEQWVADFVPGATVIRRAMVWLRLPGLPLEYWSPVLLKEIAAAAGRPLSVDVVTEHGQKAAFARLKVVIDTTVPLVPGVTVRSRAGSFWQPFVYENLPEVCFSCGCLGHSEDLCSEASAKKTPGSSLPPEDRASDEQASAAARPRMGPWLLATRLQQPRASGPEQARPSGKASSSAAPAPVPSPAAGSGLDPLPKVELPMVFQAKGAGRSLPKWRAAGCLSAGRRRCPVWQCELSLPASRCWPRRAEMVGGAGKGRS